MTGVILLGSLMGACSSTTTGPVAPVDFTLCFDVYSSDGSPAAGNGPPKSASCQPAPAGACVPLGSDPDRSLSVVIGTNAAPNSDPNGGSWHFDLPNQCNSVPGCGFAVVTIDANRADAGSRERSFATAGPAVLIPGDAFAAGPGQYTIRVQLLNSDGTPAVDAKGQKYTSTLDIDVCAAADAGVPVSRDSGADGSTVADASKDAGAAATDGASDASKGDAREGGPPSSDASRDAKGE